MVNEPEYPRYPKLSETGKVEASEFVENLKSRIRKTISDAIGLAAIRSHNCITSHCSVVCTFGDW